MATNIFQIAIERLLEFGFYDFLLPFILFTTILYAMLRKTQILGESAVIHGIVSVGVGLFIFALPVIIGIGIVPTLTRFFAQMSIFMIVILFGLLVASFFYPNLMERLPQMVTTGGPLQLLVYIVIIIAVFMGLFSIGWESVVQLVRTAGINIELAAISGVILGIFIIFLFIAMATGREV